MPPHRPGRYDRGHELPLLWDVHVAVLPSGLFLEQRLCGLRSRDFLPWLRLRPKVPREWILDQPPREIAGQENTKEFVCIRGGMTVAVDRA